MKHEPHTQTSTKPLTKSISKRQTKPLRVVDTKTLTRDEWLDVRLSGIGSSDAAAAIGLNPYKSALALWLEKTGRDQLMPKPDFEDDSLPTYWGNILEPIVAAHYTKRTGRKVRRINAVLQHPNEPWMLANIDREVIGSDEVQILECKTAGIQGSRLWRDGVPEYVQIQVMHQLAVTGKPAADVAVLLGGQELQVFRIERNETMIAQLIELERRFWQYVQDDTPPPVDGTDSADLALRCLFPDSNTETIDLSTCEEWNNTFERLTSVRHTLQELSAEEALLKQRIQQQLGEAGKAVFLNGVVTWKRSKDSVTLDTNKLSQEHPQLTQTYLTTKRGSRRFLITPYATEHSNAQAA